MKKGEAHKGSPWLQEEEYAEMSPLGPGTGHMGGGENWVMNATRLATLTSKVRDPEYRGPEAVIPSQDPRYQIRLHSLAIS